MAHPYTLGCDVSTWQGEWDPAIAAAQGCEFAWVRAGSVNSATGKAYMDNQFDRNIGEAPGHMRTGAYWYLRPNWNVSAQADFFSDLLAPHAAAPRFLGAMPDVEYSGGLDQGTMRARVFQFIQEVQANLALPNDKVVVYTRASFWNVALGSVPWVDSYPMCVARYRYVDGDDVPDLLGPWSDGRFKVVGRADWDFWQFSADGNGLGPKYGAKSAAIDLQYRREPFAPPTEPPEQTVTLHLGFDVAEALAWALDEAGVP